MLLCSWILSFECFTEILKAVRVLKLYKKGLFKTVEILYGKNNLVGLMQEDNDQKHNITLCTQLKEKNHIVTLD